MLEYSPPMLNVQLLKGVMHELQTSAHAKTLKQRATMTATELTKGSR